MTFIPPAGDLINLAPVDLAIRRIKRYHGDDQALNVQVLTAEDQSILFRLYDFLRGLHDVVRSEDQLRREALNAYVDLAAFTTIADSVARLGVSSYERSPGKLLAEVLHDVRGGGLSAILGTIQLWRLRGGTATTCETLRLLCRDHLKIMRNALLGLDDPQRDLDLSLKLHSSDLILEKWQKMRIPADGKELQLESHCPYTFPIAECCVEFGAIDRILYNLLNNAARHTADSRVRLTLFPVPPEDSQSLRFIMQNSVSKSDRERLLTADFARLFQPGVSTTGSGYGLAVVAEFVAHAYGLRPAEALAGGYLGACLLGGDFTVWFHWPIVPELSATLE